MLAPTIIDLNYTYKKQDSDVWVLNIDDIPIDKSMMKDQQIVHLAPQSVGGNHKHPRTEWFVAMGDLVLSWIDENGDKKEEHMNPNGKLKLITMPSFLAHAITNRSRTQTGILFELSDEKMRAVEKIEVAKL